MHHSPSLFSDFNFEQMLASALIGAGAALMLAVIYALFQKPKVYKEGQPPQKLHPLAALLLFVIGLALLLWGITWRSNT